MAKIPTTSTTLLRDVANDSQHARWGEFVARYRPAMEAFMRVRFPSLDADDVIQETLVAVWAWNWPQTHKRLWMIAIGVPHRIQLDCLWHDAGGCATAVF